MLFEESNHDYKNEKFQDVFHIKFLLQMKRKSSWRNKVAFNTNVLKSKKLLQY